MTYGYNIHYLIYKVLKITSEEGTVIDLYQNEIPQRVDTIVLSNQRTDEISLEEIKRDLVKLVIEQIARKELLINTRYLTNPIG